MALQTLFATAAEAAQVLTANYAAGAYNPTPPTAGAGVVRVPNPCTIIAWATIAVADADRIEFQLQLSTLGDADWVIVPCARDRGSYIEYVEKPISIPGAIAADVPVLFTIPPGWYDSLVGGDLRIRARSVGGAGGTTLFVEGKIHVDQLWGVSGTPGSTLPASGDEFELLAAALLPASPAAFSYSAAFDSGDSDLLKVAINKTGANIPTSIEFDLQIQMDGEWRTDTAIQSVAAGLDNRLATIISRADDWTANPTRHVERIEIEPLTTYRLGARYNGGTQPTVELIGQLLKR